MKLLALLTSARPQVYFESTLEAIQKGGAWSGEKLIFSDGEYCHKNNPDWSLRVEQKKIGEARAMWKCFEIAVEKDAESLTFLEDDIVLCKNALTYIENFTMPDHLAFVTWYDAFRQKNSNEKGVFEEEIYENLYDDVLGFRGACAFTITKKYLKIAVDHIAFKKWPFLHFGDGLMGLVFNKQKFGVHVPNLVQHVGDVSSTGNGNITDFRRSHTFPGVDFNALSLL